MHMILPKVARVC